MENFIILPPSHGETHCERLRSPADIPSARATRIRFFKCERCVTRDHLLFRARGAARGERRPIGEGAQTLVVCGPLISLW